MKRRTLITGLALLPLPLWLQAADEPVSDHSLKDFSIGEIISGDPVQLDALAGKVVALEFWGIR